MNVKDIKEIINLMNENALSEIEIERDGLKLKLKKTSSNEPPAIVSSSTPHYTVESVPAPKGNAQAPVSNQTQKNGMEIKSPMVGTFYRASSPESPPFVEVGQIVEVGQVVCIVEAMKLLNEIKSEVRGRVVEAAVANAEPVEFGQILFVVEPV